MEYPQIDIRDLCKALGVEYDPANSTAYYLLMATQYRYHYVAAQPSVHRTALPCGHDINNLRMGVNGYGCAECESARR